MKLFISWSGERSQLLADALCNWLPFVINMVEPWVSSNNIEPGSRWSPEIANHLEQTQYGIVCLTRENLSAPWILFEAGALSKIVEKSKVVPLLLDNERADIQGPLAQFQALQVKKDDIRKLLNSINDAVIGNNEKGLEESKLSVSFNTWYPKLEDAVSDIPKSPTPLQASMRSDRDILDEILVSIRSIRNEISFKKEEEFISNLYKIYGFSSTKLPKHLLASDLSLFDWQINLPKTRYELLKKMTPGQRESLLTIIAREGNFQVIKSLISEIDAIREEEEKEISLSKTTDYDNTNSPDTESK